MKTFTLLSLFLFLTGCNCNNSNEHYKDIYWDENKDGKNINPDDVKSDDDLPVFNTEGEPQPNKIDIIEE